MKNILKYLAFFCGSVVLLLSSCARQPIDVNADTPDGKVRLEMALNYVSDKQPIQTKSELTTAQQAEIVADHVWVLILDNNATESDRVLKQAPIKAQLIENNKIYANIEAESSESWVYVLANVTTAANTYLGGLAAGATFGDLMTNQAMKLVEATGTGLTAPLPMWGTSGTVVAQIQKGTTLSQSVNLVRTVARIDVRVDPAILPANFKIKSVSLVNAAKSGWLFQPLQVPAQRLTDVIKYNPATIISSSGAGGVDNAIMSQIYCYENNGMIDATRKNITRIVVEGNYAGKTSSSFYGIDIAYIPQTGAGVEQYDIERNKIYTVNIKKIDKDGYASFDLAESSESFNSGMVSDITVTDPYSHNVVSNGKQYMGVTNTNLLIYTKDNKGAKNVLSTTVAYTTESGWSRGTISASAGISFVTSGGSVGVETLEVGSGSNPVIRDILIDVDANFVTGTIEVRIGNLTQVITVRNIRVTSPGGDIIEHFTTGVDGPKEDYVIAEIINPSSYNSWLKVSDEPSALDPSALFDRVTNPAGGIYIHVAGNIAYQNDDAAARKAQAFVTSKNDEQRYRVHIEQNYLDVYSDARPIKPYTYVGVFHRWDETAERLIRIEGNQTAYANEKGIELTGTWIASVVSGDFIMLSTEESKDPAIDEQDPYGDRGVSSWNAAQVESQGTFDAQEGRKVVTGTINMTTPNIYFKVATTGRLASFNSQPRYGLIAITYSTGAGLTLSTQTQFVYVRQGEEPDYLMRPSDPILYTAAYLHNNFTGLPATNVTALNAAKEPMATRPLARKLAPFNLRANVDGVSGLITNVGIKDHNFVDYPSKGGDYYFMLGSTFIRKNNGNYNTAGVVAGDWTPSVSESCPYGYRRIGDSKTPNTTLHETTIAVNGSENRQSYWLFPMKSMYLSNFSNQIRGFLSDGYFDRRLIGANVKGLGSMKISYAHSVVRNNNSGIEDKDIQHAYWGYLVFNPYNYASVFMPITGMFGTSGNNSTFSDEASFGGVWTNSKYSANANSTTNTAATFWITNFGHINGEEVFDNYKSAHQSHAYPIRCIRDEGEPVIGPIDGKVTITPFQLGTGRELYNVRIEYNQASGTLEAQLTAALGANISKMNGLSVICAAGNSPQAADYAYLNSIVDNSQSLSSTNSLHHVVIRGAGTQSIPSGAFTSQYWRSITIIDAKTFANGAFNLPSNSLLYDLSLGYFGKDISITNGAFSGGITTQNVNLKLRGWAMTQASVNATPATWLTLPWKTIKEYK